MASKSRKIPITDDAKQRVAAEAARIVAAVFQAERWELKDKSGNATSVTDVTNASLQEQLEMEIARLVEGASTYTGRFLPEMRRGQLKVEFLPDFDEGYVWLRVGTVSWRKAEDQPEQGVLQSEVANEEQ
jgi:hypothetical protein